MPATPSRSSAVSTAELTVRSSMIWRETDLSGELITSIPKSRAHVGLSVYSNPRALEITRFTPALLAIQQAIIFTSSRLVHATRISTEQPATTPASSSTEGREPFPRIVITSSSLSTFSALSSSSSITVIS